MSYIRWAEKRDRFDGESEMYVYGYGDDKISCNGYDDKDMIEMLDEWWITEEKEFKEWFIRRLAKRLNIESELKDNAVSELGEGGSK